MRWTPKEFGVDKLMAMHKAGHPRRISGRGDILATTRGTKGEPVSHWANRRETGYQYLRKALSQVMNDTGRQGARERIASGRASRSSNRSSATWTLTWIPLKSQNWSWGW